MDEVVTRFPIVGQRILDKVDDNGLVNGYTPLHMAAELGHLDIVKCLAKHLENKNPAMKNGETPIYHAAGKGHLEIIEYIAQYVEDKNPARYEPIP